LLIIIRSAMSLIALNQSAYRLKIISTLPS
jgi:hypothetical protein